MTDFLKLHEINGQFNIKPKNSFDWWKKENREEFYDYISNTLEMRNCKRNGETICINVKTYNWGKFYNKIPNSLFNSIFESCQENWWEDYGDIDNYENPRDDTRIECSGRSGGWLVFNQATFRNGSLGISYEDEFERIEYEIEQWVEDESDEFRENKQLDESNYPEDLKLNINSDFNDTFDYLIFFVKASIKIEESLKYIGESLDEEILYRLTEVAEESGIKIPVITEENIKEVCEKIFEKKGGE